MITKERVGDFKRYHQNGERLTKEDQGQLLEYVSHLEEIIYNDCSNITLNNEPVKYKKLVEIFRLLCDIRKVEGIPQPILEKINSIVDKNYKSETLKKMDELLQ